jgi:uncharacterized protein with NRDE domain
VESEVYGTCSSALVFIKKDGTVTFIERSYRSNGQRCVEPSTVKIQFRVAEHL